MAKILVVDDDKAINELIKVNLELQGYEVIQAYDGTEGFALAKQEEPSLIVLDVMMPEVDGFTVAQRIRQCPEIADTPIIMLTALSELNDKVNGFNLGVDDYLTKPFEPDELVVRVRALLKRTNQIPKTSAVRDLLTYKEITLIPESYSVQINEKVQKLTPIEYDIFNLLFQNHGNMVSAKRLLKEIWGYEPDDSVETIRVHIRHLRSKIDKISGDKKYIQLGTVLKNPLVLSLLAGVVIYFCRVPVPQFFRSPMVAIAGMNAPLAMIVLGVYLAQTDLKAIFTRPRLYALSAVRLVVIPLLTIACLLLLPAGWKKIGAVLVIVNAAPIGSNIAVYAQRLGLDSAYAVQMVCLSTLLSLVTLPVVLSLAAMVGFA